MFNCIINAKVCPQQPFSGDFPLPCTPEHTRLGLPKRLSPKPGQGWDPGGSQGRMCVPPQRRQLQAAQEIDAQSCSLVSPGEANEVGKWGIH